MVTPPQNENFVINHLPPCRSKPLKALFVFGTQFKIFIQIIHIYIIQRSYNPH